MQYNIRNETQDKPLEKKYNTFASENIELNKGWRFHEVESNLRYGIWT